MEFNEFFTIPWGLLSAWHKMKTDTKVLLVQQRRKPTYYICTLLKQKWKWRKRFYETTLLWTKFENKKNKNAKKRNLIIKRHSGKHWSRKCLPQCLANNNRQVPFQYFFLSSYKIVRLQQCTVKIHVLCAVPATLKDWTWNLILPHYLLLYAHCVRLIR